jgi:hypothetical protein
MHVNHHVYERKQKIGSDGCEMVVGKEDKSFAMACNDLQQVMHIS